MGTGLDERQGRIVVTNAENMHSGDKGEKYSKAMILNDLQELNHCAYSKTNMIS